MTGTAWCSTWITPLRTALMQLRSHIRNLCELHTTRSKAYTFLLRRSHETATGRAAHKSQAHHDSVEYRWRCSRALGHKQLSPPSVARVRRVLPVELSRTRCARHILRQLVHGSGASVRIIRRTSARCSRVLGQEQYTCRASRLQARVGRELCMSPRQHGVWCGAGTHGEYRRCDRTRFRMRSPSPQ